jgi:hypothetical protein
MIVFDVLTIVGSLANIASLAFAFYVYRHRYERRATKKRPATGSHRTNRGSL